MIVLVDYKLLRNENSFHLFLSFLRMLIYFKMRILQKTSKTVV